MSLFPLSSLELCIFESLFWFVSCSLCIGLTHLRPFLCHLTSCPAGMCYDPAEQIPHGGMIYPGDEDIPFYDADHGPTVSAEEAAPPLTPELKRFLTRYKDPVTGKPFLPAAHVSALDAQGPQQHSVLSFSLSHLSSPPICLPCSLTHCSVSECTRNLPEDPRTPDILDEEEMELAWRARRAHANGASRIMEEHAEDEARTAAHVEGLVQKRVKKFVEVRPCLLRCVCWLGRVALISALVLCFVHCKDRFIIKA